MMKSIIKILETPLKILVDALFKALFPKDKEKEIKFEEDKLRELILATVLEVNELAPKQKDTIVNHLYLYVQNNYQQIESEQSISNFQQALNDYLNDTVMIIDDAVIIKTPKTKKDIKSKDNFSLKANKTESELKNLYKDYKED